MVGTPYLLLTLKQGQNWLKQSNICSICVTFDEASTFTDGKLHAYYGSPKRKYGKNGNEIPEISSFFKDLIKNSSAFQRLK